MPLQWEFLAATIFKLENLDDSQPSLSSSKQLTTVSISFCGWVQLVQSPYKKVHHAKLQLAFKVAVYPVHRSVLYIPSEVRHVFVYMKGVLAACFSSMSGQNKVRKHYIFCGAVSAKINILTWFLFLTRSAGSFLSFQPSNSFWRFHSFKGTVSRNFLLLVFFMGQFPPSPRVSN